MNYEEIIKIEPRVHKVIEKLKPTRSWNDYEKIKKQITPLVGWYAEKEELRNENAYEIIINTVADRLAL